MSRKQPAPWVIDLKNRWDAESEKRDDGLTKKVKKSIKWVKYKLQVNGKKEVEISDDTFELVSVILNNEGLTLQPVAPTKDETGKIYNVGFNFKIACEYD